MSDSESKPKLFGFEFTFTNPVFLDAGRSYFVEAYRIMHEFFLNRWVDQLLSKYGDFLEVRPLDLDRYGYGQVIVKIPSRGLEFKIFNDPFVFEVTGTPMTLEQIAASSGLLEELIFGTAKAVDLEPHDDRVGGGHIHLDIAGHFEGNYWLFRNFIVDLENRPELFMGGFSLDLLNAPPMAVMKQEQRDEYIKILAEFDALPDDTEDKIKKFCLAIKERVYNVSYFKEVDHQDEYIGFEHKYHLINVSHEQTLEIRGLRPQKCIAEAYFMCSVFQNRIKKLKQQFGRTALDYQARDLRDKVSVHVENDTEFYDVAIDQEVLDKAVTDYISDSFCSADDQEEGQYDSNDLDSALNREDFMMLSLLGRE